MTLISVFIISLLISLMIVNFARKLAIAKNIVSLSSPRKLHTSPIPLLGGVSFFISGILFIFNFQQDINISVFLEEKIFFLAGLSIVAGVGLWDDIRGLSSKMKFVGQSLAAVLLIMNGCRIESFFGVLGESFQLGVFSIPFTFLWIMMIINAINLLDGLDGLAGGIAFIITLAILIFGILGNNLNISVLALILMGSLLAFLSYNFHPAKIFMGDLGSLILGYLIAFLSIEGLKISGSHQINILSALAIFALPVGDVLVSFFRRLGSGKNPFSADKQHIHHRLIKLGLSHRETVLILYIYTFIAAVCGILLFIYSSVFALIIFLIFLVINIYLVWRLGYVETRYSHQNFVNQIRKTVDVRRRAPIIFSRIGHVFLLLFSDIITINIAFYLVLYLKFHSGIWEPEQARNISEFLTSPVFLIFTIGWLIIFFLSGLYLMRWDISRFDKSFRIIKVITFGTIVVGLITLDINQLLNKSQIITLFFYWFTLVFLVNTGRLLIIYIEKKLKIFEYSPKRTLIIGSGESAEHVIEDISVNPHFIYEVVGLISENDTTHELKGIPIIGKITDLPSLIHDNKIEEIIIAMDTHDNQEFLDIISLCEQQQVKIKSAPGNYEMINQYRESLTGHSYLTIFPETMVLWQWMIKRSIDIIFSFILIIFVSPIIIFTAIYLKLIFHSSIFVKIRIVGKFGIPFNMYVFRLTPPMENETKDPIYNGSGEYRANMTPLLKIIIRYRIYKIPQLFNVLLGDMSLVGPRPETLEWYRENENSVNFLTRRALLRPGISGLAQIKYHYELTPKILKERVRYDIFYSENLSLRLDMRILLRTLLMIVRKPGEIREIK